VLAERRFVIDFAAGRRMVVTDDIEAKLAITEVSYRCCRALDRMDPDLMDTVWHPDGTADYGPAFRGSASGLLEVMWAPASTEERGCTCSRSPSF
jgi:SnoaL-like domain